MFFNLFTLKLLVDLNVWERVVCMCVAQCQCMYETCMYGLVCMWLSVSARLMAVIKFFSPVVVVVQKFLAPSAIQNEGEFYTSVLLLFLLFGILVLHSESKCISVCICVCVCVCFSVYFCCFIVLLKALLPSCCCYFISLLLFVTVFFFLLLLFLILFFL